MKIFVIGGTGHMGSFLVPMLVSEGHEVYIGTRGRKPTDRPCFNGAKFIQFDASKDEDIKGLIQYGFDTVVDFPGTAYRVWGILKNHISHLVACGSLWMFGCPKKIPTPEVMQSEVPFAVYKRRSAEIHEMAAESGKCKAVFSAVMPPNVCGPGKIPIDQKGDREIEFHKEMMRGEKVYLPEGAEALIGPCDAEDLAALFDLVINNREKSKGQIFNGGSEYALTATELVKAYGKIYGTEIPIEYISFERFKAEVAPEIGAWWHFYAHMVPDITKAKTLLGYKPKYTPEESLARAVEWMKKENLL